MAEKEEGGKKSEGGVNEAYVKKLLDKRNKDLEKKYKDRMQKYEKELKTMEHKMEQELETKHQ